ncbi:MAG: hypothetical protein ABI867_41990 [Kofleriaceae bacterium]
MPLPEASPPFPYLNHGVLALDMVGKSAGAYIGFREPVVRGRHTTIMRGCPGPIAGFRAWGPTLLSTETGGDVFDWELAERYGELTEAALARFAAEVERWAMAVHAVAPIAFFIGPLGAERPSEWGAQSRALFPSLVIPFLERYADAHALELSDDDDTEDPTDRRFDQTAMACLLQHIPDSEDVDLTRRTEELRERFPL